MQNPTEIKLRTRSRVLEVVFDDGARYLLPFEYLRVFSPSAEVKGHGPGQEVLVTGKQNVGIHAVEPVGQYAVKLVFDDGHNTGLYSWQYLRELGEEQPGTGRSTRREYRRPNSESWSRPEAGVEFAARAADNP